MNDRWQNTLLRLALIGADLLLARSCVGCDLAFEPGTRANGWCPACLAAVRSQLPRCRICGREGECPECEPCRAKPPPFARTLLLGRYAPPLDRIVRSFKFRRDPALGSALAAALAPTVSSALAIEPGPSSPIVVPIPLSVERLAERGYNQSALIARPLARRLRLPFEPQALRRSRAGPAQSGLGPQARQRNVDQAFVAPQPLSQPVLLVDDVMTTGATLAAAAQALIAAGAPSITCVVVARTQPPDVQRRPGSP